MKFNNLFYTYINNDKFSHLLAQKYLLRKEKDEDFGNIIIVGAHDDCTAIEIPEWIEGIRVIGIDENAFCGMANLEKLSIPESIIIVEKNAFSENVLVEYEKTTLNKAEFLNRLELKRLKIIEEQLRLYARFKNKWVKVIDIIKKAKNKEQAAEMLIKKFEISEEQANLILASKLSVTSSMSSINIEEELNKFYIKN